MKKIPRDISGRELCKRLKVFNYEITRQSGSHIRLTTQVNGEHSITIPDHPFIKIGTLSAILSEVANHQKVSKEELAEKIF